MKLSDFEKANDLVSEIVALRLAGKGAAGGGLEVYPVIY